PFDPRLPGALEPGEAAELLKRARRARPAESRRLLAGLEERHGPREAGWGVDWAFLAEEERIRVATLLGRGGEVGRRAAFQAERLRREGAPGGLERAVAYERRFLAAAPGALLSSEVRAAWTERGQASELAEARARRLDADRLVGRAREWVDALDMPGRPWCLSRGDEVLGGTRGPLGGETVRKDLGPPWEGCSLVAGLPAAEVEALHAMHRYRIAALGVVLAALGTAGLGVRRGQSAARRLAGAREAFVASVGRELRTPLAGIRAVAGTLAEGAPPDRARAGALVVLRHARRLDRLVARVLSHAGALGPARAPRLAASDLGRVVAEAVRDFAQGEQLPIDLVIPDAPVPCRLDPEAMGEALGELLENAVRFGPPGGTVTVCVGVEEARAFIAVTDRGPGIPREEQARVFEAWSRSEQPLARSLGGLGLGLARVREVARAHGGEAEVESEPGQGATFTILLPLELGQPAGGPAGAALVALAVGLAAAAGCAAPPVPAPPPAAPARPGAIWTVVLDAGSEGVLAGLPPPEEGGGATAPGQAWEDLLLEQGVLEARVEAVPARGGPLAGGELRVRPGPRYRLGRVRFEGHGELSTEDLEAAVAAPPGSPPAWYSHEERLRLREAILARYRAAGRLAAEVDLVPSFDRQASRVDLVARVLEGPRLAGD
ncbi:MAG: hypothetical protein HY722_14150, partial [Planctomycetes bacterium]|nr:hypothetical protein [Planctomycetota bacterium]